MEENFEHQVYDKNTIEFVTVANEFCILLESSGKISKMDFIDRSQKLLPLLYLKASLLPKVENQFDGEIEKFVGEGDWEYIRTAVIEKMGANDEYLEVFDDGMRDSDEPIVASISENFADIYQDLKDFLTSYRIASVDIMNDALWDLNNNFYQYWGQSVVNSLRAIHYLLAHPEKMEDDLNDQASSSIDRLDMSQSIFSQRQQQWGNEEE
ncbi:DUF5063 domain-containing protein [Ancylomarina euxinus]|uniref:DUF5063 domain-containing protein n=1 Tax=Ancylomarina euxinus TaxID=2283627 RepID=A0A425XX10_9BACT|nr:DUF5063 domain-containing protein [Ancylomarina euxinus]MCZ4696246.1 DUF5063 domain-containing protein [Ancylomarina euxinus]MUP16621.1 DUF5063 domain-containing protein [Ancylomarina euxinus]RRG19182.1 DUF5063 domain-containing protein [Ancylomarina euxinus]